MKLIIAILILALTTFAQNTTYKDGTDCKCDSIERRYHESGELFVEIPYKNGDKHGIQKQYSNHLLKWENRYNQGTLILERYYYNNGVLARETPCRNGKAHGISNYYYESGALITAIHYVNGKAHGTWKEYFENGNLASNSTYNNGNLVGYKKCSDGRVGNENLNCLK